jgi:hypothetical protein
MAINFTQPKRKNVDLSFTSGTDVLTTLTSSLERGVTILEINKPQGVTLSSPNDAADLETILADAEIAFQADGQGFTNGGNVTEWVNNGTLGADYNVKNTTGGQYPTFDTDDTDNPFSTTGSILFKDSNVSTGTSQFLSFRGTGTGESAPLNPAPGENLVAYNQTYNPEYESSNGPFVIYQVFAYETGFNTSVPPAVTSNVTSNLVPGTSGFDQGGPTSRFNAVMYRPAIQFESNDLNIYDRDSTSQFAIYLDYQEKDLAYTAEAGEPFVQVIYRDAKGEIYVFDQNGQQVAHEPVDPTETTSGFGPFGHDNQAGFKFQFGAFGRVGNLEPYTFSKPAANVGSYIAAFGVINKDITKIKAQNLGRLLGEKYLP